MELVCKVCKKIVSEDIERISSQQRYIECPYCGRITENPLYKNESV